MDINIDKNWSVYYWLDRLTLAEVYKIRLINNEWMRLVLCFAFNCGIRVEIALMVWGKAPRYPNDFSV